MRALEAVKSLDEDRILRAFSAVIQATLRTNYFQLNAEQQPKAYFSFKLDPAQVPDLPLPRPMFEIFVYSPRVEGVHLRMGHVARGGIRWSDRREDFRTEVLGLMKAQNVKNTVIVPVGAKGGFVPKRLPGGSRDEIQREVIACYRTFIRGLLDITDNIVDERIVPPALTVRRDDDDPYLVVAADKGTATFSDIANAISAEYDFWLGDAFASGGSAGYDHKKMAITARGAWECVKRHFREMGIDTQTQDFTVVGIGDMAGDVFGNGMLQSPHIRLVAAFNHQHIFLDPDPDAAARFAERQRLFKLPRSTWEDYNRKLISKGGGVFSRAAKSISLELPGTNAPRTAAPRARRRWKSFARSSSCRSICSGTAASAPTSRRAARRMPTSAIAPTMRCASMAASCAPRSSAKAAISGLSQLGRIEYALTGGRLNTDFIDNSGGRQLLGPRGQHQDPAQPAGAGRESSRRSARDRLLVQMTDEVARWCCATTTCRARRSARSRHMRPNASASTCT